MPTAEKPNTPQVKFFEVRVGSVLIGKPLPYEVHLLISGQPVLFRKRGDALSPDRAKQAKRFV
jgi:hypothetical protein